MSIIERKQADNLFLWLFCLLAIAQLLYLLYNPLLLAADETHYWVWSRHLDWSYYSKGPLIALLISASTAIFGDTAFAVRLPAMVCSLAFSLFFYAFVRRYYNASSAILTWLALRLTLMFHQMGIVMTTDAPAALFLLLAVLSVYFATIEERRGCWVLFGVFLGCGILAKYTLLALYPSVVFFLLVFPALRQELHSKMFLLGSVVFALFLTPILYWNYQHDWVNIAHNAGHVVKHSGSSLTLKYLGELIAGQIGLISPIIFFGLIWAMQRGYQLARKGEPAAGLFFCTTLPLALLVLAISLTKRVYANWPLPIYVSAFLLGAHVLGDRPLTDPRLKEWLRRGISLACALTVFAHLPVFGITFGFPGRLLPTKKLFGWDKLANDFDIARENNRSNGELPFLLADDYETISELTFYSKLHPEGYCAVLDDRRMNQYDIWGGIEHEKGRNALVVLSNPEKVEGLKKYFARISPILPQPNTNIQYMGDSVHQYYFYLAENYSGEKFPLPVAR